MVLEGSVHDCLAYVQKLSLKAKEVYKWGVEAAQLLVNR